VGRNSTTAAISTEGGITLAMADAGWHHNRLSRLGRRLLTGDDEAGRAGHDAEAFLLEGVDVFADNAAGHAAPLKRTSSPPLSGRWHVYSIHSPVAGLKKGRNLVM
jgi:hypothetical protein